MPDRALLTTDDLEHAVRLNAQLEAAGFETTLTSSLDDVRHAVQRRNPDCIILTGGLHETGGRNWLVWPNPEGEQAMKVGDWNDVQFSVRGNHIVTYVNGVKALDYTDPSPKYSDGIIALQLHAGGEGKMRFKDLYLREID